MDDAGGVILGMLAGAILTLAAFAAADRAVDSTRPEPITVVLPTCVELDSYGYDGTASCIDHDGRIVRPGG